jgi:hypothetical protein
MILSENFSLSREQNNWFAASDKKLSLAPFLSTVLVHERYNGIDSPFNYGEKYYNLDMSILVCYLLITKVSN